MQKKLFFIIETDRVLCEAAETVERKHRARCTFKSPRLRCVDDNRM